MSNGYTYNNNFFPASFSEYLVVNGFEMKEIWNTIQFTKGNMKLAVMNDNMDVFENGIFSHSLDGFSEMNLFEFMRVMNASLIVSVEGFVNNAARMGDQQKTEAKFLYESYHYMFNQSISLC